MNVTFVIPYFYPAWHYGGQPRSAYELARALVSRGHRVKVLTTDSAGDTRLPSGHRDIDGVQVIYYRNISNWLAFRQRLFWPPSMFRDLRRELAGSDVLHIHELRSTLSVPAYRAASRLKMPYVLSTHGGLRHLGKASLKAMFDALWGKNILRRAAAVIAISPVEELDARSMDVEQERIRRLPNMISVSDYEPLPQKGLFRARWQLGSSKTILFLGRLHWIKGADLLIRAFERLYASDRDTRLVIAGPDDGAESSLRDLAARAGLNSAVVFTGFLDHQQKVQALVDANLVVVPSRSEVFAITAIEALMCGCPVLLSTACGLHPMPQPEQGAVQFKTEDIDDLAGALSAAVANASLGVAAQAGREFVKSEFSSDKVGACAESIYQSVVRS
ncbi:MAG TPA: glycosyltransferase [Candidatus Binatia bacterium]